MIHFRTRNDLLEWLDDNAPYRQIRRAVAEGEVELYGYFKGSAFMPEGWVVRVKSRFGKEWLMCIYLKPHAHAYHTMAINTVIWYYWQGGNSELFQGDNPGEYERKKKEWDDITS